MLWNGIKPITSLTKHRQRPKYPEPWRNALGSKGKIAAHMHDGRHKRCEGRPTCIATVQSKLQKLLARSARAPFPVQSAAET